MNEFDDATKSIATVRDVARMVGLSPARFYQLMAAGVFPMPAYDIHTRRPHFTEEQQRQCLEVRRRNCGINGKPICFYARRLGQPTPTPQPRAARTPSPPRKNRDHAGLVEALKGLGLTVAAPQVTAAIEAVFPKGVGATPESEVIRAVFLHLKRQDKGDSVGR